MCHGLLQILTCKHKKQLLDSILGTVRDWDFRSWLCLIPFTGPETIAPCYYVGDIAHSMWFLTLIPTVFSIFNKKKLNLACTYVSIYLNYRDSKSLAEKRLSSILWFSMDFFVSAIIKDYWNTTGEVNILKRKSSTWLQKNSVKTLQIQNVDGQNVAAKPLTAKPKLRISFLHK